METETFIMLAVQLRYVSEREAEAALALMTEIGKMLTVLRRRLAGGEIGDRIEEASTENSSHEGSG
jgi:hypothetical protein